MYNVVTISDLIQISPMDHEKRSARALEDNINAKYADKVIHKVGLVVGLYDILNFSEGLIGHGTGVVNVHVDFRLAVFRPFKGEILQGKIVANDELGIRISMDFFDDVYVPGPHMLFDNSLYNSAEDAWVWKTDDGVELFFDRSETVRFRVEAETWHDLAPSARPGEQPEQDEYPKSPYSITASMQQSGLGPLLWWEDGGDGEEGEEEG